MSPSILLVACCLFAGEGEGAGPVAMPVTLQQCIYLAEKNSLPLRVDEVNVQIAEAELGQGLGKFDTVAFAGYSYQKNILPTASRFVQGDVTDTTAAPVVEGIVTKTHSANAGFRGSLIGGGSYESFMNFEKYFDSAGSYGNFNPSYTSNTGLSISQPLLKGFGSTLSKADILQARNSLAGTAEALEESRVTRANDVIQAYWNYYFAQQNLETRNFLVEQAERLVVINKKKLEVGDGKRIDVIQAESELATRRQEAIAAQNEIGRTADDLKRLIFPFRNRDEWEAELVPLTKAMEDSIETANWREASQRALERRPELRRLRELLKNNDIEIVVAENALLPQLDLNASMQLNQLASRKGDAFNYSDEFYNVGGGLSLEVPIGNRVARYGLAIARLRKVQALLQYKDLENQVIQEVRNGVRDVRNQKEQIDAAREAVRLAAERWSSEQKRQEVGYSTTYEVTDAEAGWQEAVDNQLRALFDYQISLASLKAAQGTLLEYYGMLPSPRPKLKDGAGILYQP